MNFVLQRSTVLVAALLFGSTSHAQQLLATLNGSAAERFGTAIADAGDLNGDGFDDVVVGSPGHGNNIGRVQCISGQFLATGVGASVLWTYDASWVFNSGALFGSAVANVGDLTGDGVPEFAVGAPGVTYNPVGASGGAVLIVNGATASEFKRVYGNTANQRFGSSIATVGDTNGDGVMDFAVSAPGVQNQLSGGVAVLSGGAIASLPGISTLALPVMLTGNSGEAGFGWSIASGFDLDGDGFQDIAIGSPFATFTNGPFEGGALWVMKALPTPPGHSSPIFAQYRSNTAGEHLGKSVDAKHDYNGDGVVDFVVGAPDRIGGINSLVGRAVVVSGARMLSNTAPQELYVLDPIIPNPQFTTLLYGAAVCASPDLNGDGVGEILVGSPAYSISFPSGPGRGAVWIYSGRTGVRIGGVTGANNERLGDALLGGFDDLDGDGFLDFLVGGSSADTPSTDCGKLKSYRLFPTFAGVYCTAKVNSLGCSPAMSWNGSASATSASPFLVTCSNVLNQRVGMLTYSFAPRNTPYQGGTLCIATPFARTNAQGSGGSPTGSDCTGAYAFDFNARIQSGIDPALVVGAEVFTQYRARDPQAISSSSLSNALRFVVNP
jgi:hypothetical protein